VNKERLLTIPIAQNGSPACIAAIMANILVFQQDVTPSACITAMGKIQNFIPIYK
jgi:hypothetical protein